MAYTDTEVYLINTRLDSENNHTYYFSLQNEQFNFMKGSSLFHFENLTYIRKDSAIRIPKHIDELMNCNYLMFCNKSYTTRWYYAFIKDMIYKDDGMTEVIFELDYIQTYLFDYWIDKSFIEREHVKDDTIGLHTIPENLETGPYMCSYSVNDLNMKDYFYMLHVSEVRVEKDNYVDHRSVIVGGVPLDGSIYVCPDSYSFVSTIKNYEEDGKSDAILNAYMVPKSILHDPKWSMYADTNSPKTYEISIDKPAKLNLYEPKNNKLFTYPYCYLVVDNNNGVSNILQFEHFDTSKCYFKISGVPVPGGSIKCVPKDYKGMVENEIEGIMGGKFPLLSWSEDWYTNWLTQNSLNLNVGIASSVASIIGGAVLVATGVGSVAGAGLLAGGVGKIASTAGEIYQHSQVPATAKGNVNGGDINTCSKTNTIYLYAMTIKSEYAEIIDNYFNMFGYKVSTLKVPNKNHRKHYWYTKTIDANVMGCPQQKARERIKACYDKGITFWRHTSNFKTYEDNPII